MLARLEIRRVVKDTEASCSFQLTAGGHIVGTVHKRSSNGLVSLSL